MIRRTLAVLAVSAVSLVGLAPAASANPLNDLIANAGCGPLGVSLRVVYTIDDNTTRNDLAKQIRDSVNAPDPAAALVAFQTANRVADRALECGIVKKDPEFIPGSSDLGDLGGLADLATVFSSTLRI